MKAYRLRDTLFGEFTRNRPRRYAEAVVDAAAVKCLRSLAMSLDEPMVEDSLRWTDSLADIRGVLLHCTDGYDRARALDSEGWEPSAAMVETLDLDWIGSELHEAITAWVIEQHIELMLPIGARVSYEALPGGSRYIRPEDRRGYIRHEGVVTGRWDVSASYTVLVERLHKPPTRGAIIACEDLEVIDAVAP